MNILTKYSLFMLGMLLLATGSITAVALRSQQKALTQEAVLRGQSIAVNLALSAGDALLTRNRLHLVGLSVRATSDNEIVYAVVVDDRNQVVGHPDPQRMDKPFEFRVTSPLEMVTSKADVVEGLSGGNKVWDISVPVIPKGTKRTLGRVHVGIAKAQVEKAVRESLFGLLGAAMMVALLGLAATFMAIRFLVRPVEELSQAAEKVGLGNLEVQVPVRSKDEIGQLATNFNVMIGNLKHAEKEKLEKERIQSELNLARSIQADLLPKHPPDNDSIDMAFICRPAKELGGDFYDWFELKKGGRTAFLIADVSGKGVPAAMHMANLRNLFRFVAADEISPAETLKKVNRLAYQDLKGESFVTLIYAVFDPKTSMITMANAGHDPAYLVKKTGGLITAHDSTSLPVGLVDWDDFDPEVQEIKIKISKGDLFFTFTDGVTEAMNSVDEQFGLERLQECLVSCADATAAVEKVSRAVEDHAAGIEQSDDMTILAMIPV